MRGLVVLVFLLYGWGYSLLAYRKCWLYSISNNDLILIIFGEDFIIFFQLIIANTNNFSLIVKFSISNNMLLVVLSNKWAEKLCILSFETVLHFFSFFDPFRPYNTQKWVAKHFKRVSRPVRTLFHPFLAQFWPKNRPKIGPIWTLILCQNESFLQVMRHNLRRQTYFKK